MPLVRIDLRKGKSAAYKKAIGDAVYRAMRETFTVPDEDRFMVVTEHDDDGFFYSKSYLNIERTDDLVISSLPSPIRETSIRRRRFLPASSNCSRSSPDCGRRMCSSISLKCRKRIGRSATVSRNTPYNRLVRFLSAHPRV